MSQAAVMLSVREMWVEKALCEKHPVTWCSVITAISRYYTDNSRWLWEAIQEIDNDKGNTFYYFQKYSV